MRPCAGVPLLPQGADLVDYMDEHTIGNLGCVLPLFGPLHPPRLMLEPRELSFRVCVPMLHVNPLHVYLHFVDGMELCLAVGNAGCVLPLGCRLHPARFRLVPCEPSFDTLVAMRYVNLLHVCLNRVDGKRMPLAVLAVGPVGWVLYFCGPLCPEGLTLMQYALLHGHGRRVTMPYVRLLHVYVKLLLLNLDVNMLCLIALSIQHSRG